MKLCQWPGLPCFLIYSKEIPFFSQNCRVFFSPLSFQGLWTDYFSIFISWAGRTVRFCFLAGEKEWLFSSILCLCDCEAARHRSAMGLAPSNGANHGSDPLPHTTSGSVRCRPGSPGSGAMFTPCKGTQCRLAASELSGSLIGGVDVKQREGKGNTSSLPGDTLPSPEVTVAVNCLSNTRNSTDLKS